METLTNLKPGSKPSAISSSYTSLAAKAHCLHTKYVRSLLVEGKLATEWNNKTIKLIASKYPGYENRAVEGFTEPREI